jgi:hypothetical protein
MAAESVSASPPKINRLPSGLGFGEAQAKIGRELSSFVQISESMTN